jgi:hypothetical protein
MPTVKTVSPGGQISLGKKYSGRTVLIEQPEDGVWIIKTATTIPDNELWLHQEPVKSKLEQALTWAAQNPARATDLTALENTVLKSQPTKRSRKRGA